MAKSILTDVKVTINGTAFSTQVKQVELTVQADDKEVTAFGDGWKTHIAGLKSGSVKLDFFQDYTATTGLEAVLWPLLGTLATVVVSPTSGTATASNPNYTFTALVTTVTPLTGAVGDVATESVTWPTSGTVVKTP